MYECGFDPYHPFLLLFNCVSVGHYVDKKKKLKWLRISMARELGLSFVSFHPISWKNLHQLLFFIRCEI